MIKIYRPLRRRRPARHNNREKSTQHRVLTAVFELASNTDITYRYADFRLLVSTGYRYGLPFPSSLLLDSYSVTNCKHRTAALIATRTDQTIVIRDNDAANPKKAIHFLHKRQLRVLGTATTLSTMRDANGVARRPRNAGLTRGKAARQIPMATSDCTRILISHQHKSLAMLAGKGVRKSRLSFGSTTSGGSGPPSRTPSIPEEGGMAFLQEEDILSPLSSPVKNLSARVPSYMQSPSLDRMSLDELSLEVLCMHVSELLGGPPIPSASVVGMPLAPIDGSVEFGLGDEGEDAAAARNGLARKTSTFNIEEVNLELQAAEMKRIEAAHQERKLSVSEKETDCELLHEKAAASHDEDEEAHIRALAASAIEHQHQHEQQQQQMEEKIEINPGEFLHFYGGNKTFEALLNGNFSVTACLGCNKELMVVPFADLVVCADCWLFSPVPKYGPDGEEWSEEDGTIPPTSVGMGVTSEEVKHWFDQGNFTQGEDGTQEY